VTETDANQAPREAQSNEAIAEPAPFHAMYLSDENAENLQDWASNEDQKRLRELLHKINEESCQLSVCLAEEQKLMVELCESMAEILKRLHVSINIPPRNLPLQEKMRKVFLNEEAFLKLSLEKDEERSAFLGEYPPEVVMAVLQIVVPELHRTITSYKKKVSMRVSFFEEIKKEVKSIAKTIAGSSGRDLSTDRPAEGSIQEEDSEVENEG
jgi:hypothetical protein